MNEWMNEWMHVTKCNEMVSWNELKDSDEAWYHLVIGDVRGTQEWHLEYEKRNRKIEERSGVMIKKKICHSTTSNWKWQ